jgi:signal transduction histidine kinase
VITQRQPIQVFDVRKAVRYRSSKMARRERLASLLSVPIAFHDQLIGILNIYTASPRVFRDDEMRLLEAFASLCGIAIENAQRYERVLQAEQSIRQTDRLATLGILSAEIAHEVRNPVTIISMLLHSLREDHAIAPEREKDAEIISEKLERINRIVGQVLSFSKRRESPKEWIKINDLLEDLLFLINHNLAARQITLQRQFSQTLPEILADKGHLDQVFLNLMLNAIEAMPHGGILTIRTAVSGTKEKQSSQGVVVTIRDSGSGIPEELLPQLFSPFVTSRREGVGLGLFVSQKLLAQYGATIDVASSSESGTTFKVVIPVEEPSA